MAAPRTVACPRCGSPALYAPENRWRPFCGERCKMIDMGRWAAEEYRVPDSSPAANADAPPAGARE